MPAATALQGQTGSRMVSFELGDIPRATRVMPRAALTLTPEQGPLIIESYDTTIVVPPHCSAHADEIGNIIIDLEQLA